MVQLGICNECELILSALEQMDKTTGGKRESRDLLENSKVADFNILQHLARGQ